MTDTKRKENVDEERPEKPGKPGKELTRWAGLFYFITFDHMIKMVGLASHVTKAHLTFPGTQGPQHSNLSLIT